MQLEILHLYEEGKILNLYEEGLRKSLISMNP